MATSALPKTMKGILVEQTGGSEVLQYRTDLPVPEPKAGEVLVHNTYIGVNFIDTYFRTGLYPAPKPEILGKEAEGTIVAFGPSIDPAEGFEVGDRVAYISGNGAYAEFTVAPVARTIKVPSSIPASYAAAGLLQGLTALTLVREAHAVQKHDWILVHAAAGGVGLWLCQILRGIGARTIGTASTPEKIELAKRNGADWMVDYSHEDIATRVKEITSGEGVIAVFDGVGKTTFEADLEVLARKGSLISFGSASGPVPPFTIARLGAKNLKLARPTFFNYIATEAEFRRYASELLDLMAQEHIDVRVHDVYPLAEVARGHQDLEGRKTTGKVVLKA